jgi:hypothetical protein
MANSYYDVLEYRCVLKPEVTELFVRISNANDFMPISGWYKKTIPAIEPSMPALEKALASQEYLFWEQAAPDPLAQETQDEIKALRERIPDLMMEIAELRMGLK